MRRIQVITHSCTRDREFQESEKKMKKAATAALEEEEKVAAKMTPMKAAAKEELEPGEVGPERSSSPTPEHSLEECLFALEAFAERMKFQKARSTIITHCRCMFTHWVAIAKAVCEDDDELLQELFDQQPPAKKHKK